MAEEQSRPPALQDASIGHSFSERLWHGQDQDDSRPAVMTSSRALLHSGKGNSGRPRKSSFDLMQLSNNLAGSSEPHYIAVAGAGHPLANGVYVRMPESQHNGCSLFFHGGGYCISRELVEGEPGFILGFPPDAMYGVPVENNVFKAPEDGWESYNGVPPAPRIKALHQNILKTWGWLEIKETSRGVFKQRVKWTPRYVILAGLQLLLYSDKPRGPGQPPVSTIPLERCSIFPIVSSGGAAAAGKGPTRHEFEIRRQPVVASEAQAQGGVAQPQTRGGRSTSAVPNAGDLVAVLAAPKASEVMLWIASIEIALDFCNSVESARSDYTTDADPEGGGAAKAAPVESASRSPINSLTREDIEHFVRQERDDIHRMSKTATKAPRPWTAQIHGGAVPSKQSTSPPPVPSRQRPARPQFKPPPVPVREPVAVPEVAPGDPSAHLPPSASVIRESESAAPSEPAAPEGVFVVEGSGTSNMSRSEREGEFFVQLRKQKADDEAAEAAKKKALLDSMTDEERAQHVTHLPHDWLKPSIRM